MKKLLFLLLLPLSALADPGKIELAKATLDTSSASVMSAMQQEPVCAPSTAGTRLYLAQPETNFTAEELEAVSELGLRVYGHVPPNAYILEGTEEQIAKLRADIDFIYLGEFLPEYKTVCELDNKTYGVASASNPRYVLIAVTRDEFLPVVKEALEKEGVEYRVKSETICPCLTAHLTDTQIERLAKMSEVGSIESYSDPVFFNDVARSSHCCNLEDLRMRGYNASSQMICIHDSGLDNGDVNNIHPDFKNKRIVGMITSGASRDRGSSSWYDNSGHGTHVAGTACGTGAASDGQFCGMASGASILILACGGAAGLYVGSDSELESTYNQGARVMNNSWGSGSSGSYSSESRSYDTLVWNHKDYTVCFAAGNDNSKLNLPTECHLTPGACSKNVIAVGASENYRPMASPETEPYDGLHQGMAFFSSRGPCSDGRIKPDIAAPGTAINSCKASREATSVRSEYYTQLYGTSMASPVAAGCAAVIRDYLIKKRGVSSPSASLVKAVMFCGARTLYPGQYPYFEEIPQTRPNAVEGHGHINMQESLEPTDGEMKFKEYSVGNGQVITNFFDKPENTDLTVGLVWSDYPGTTSAAKALVNDIDLTVIDPNGARNTLNDHVNNAEVMHLRSCPAGRYTVIIKGYNIMQGPQPCSLVVNYGRGQRTGQIDFASEPGFAWGKDFCDVTLTNLNPNCYITYRAELAEDLEKCFSIEGATGTFLKSAKVRLRFNGGAGLSDYPTCVIRINCGGAGAVSRRIGFPNGSEKKGYVLYRADFSDYPYPSPVGFDASVTAAKDTTTALDNEPVDFYDSVFEENFESYSTGSILGQGGWIRSYGMSTNGTAVVVREGNNNYLSIRRSNGQFAVDVAVPGIEEGWGEGHTNRFFKISGRIRLTGLSHKSISLISPDICKTTFERQGGGFILRTGYGDATHPAFASQGYPSDNVWYPLEMLIEADSVRLGGGDRHVLRHLNFGGIEENCAAVYADNVNADRFSAIRFFLEGVGNFDLDDLKVERCVSETPRKQFLKVIGGGESSGLSEDEKGLFIHVGVPANLHRKYDLVVRGEMAMAPGTSKAVFTQNASQRQFQSEINNIDGAVSIDLTDYLTNPGLVTQTFPEDNFFTYGFRVNTAPVNKVLKTVFAGTNRYIINDQITYEGASRSSAVSDVRIYMPNSGGALKLSNLEVRLASMETPKLGVACVPFSIGDEEVEWVLTNSLPDEVISYTARITKNPDWFEVTPSSGTFSDSAAIYIKALKNSAAPQYVPGEIEIDGGDSGLFNLRFGLPCGSAESGYVLYEGDFDDLSGSDLKVRDVNWSGEESLSTTVRAEDGSGYLHLRREANSSLPEGSQGALCYIGMPSGLGYNDLDLRVETQFRFPSTFAGNFFFTQNEDQRIFQSAFASNGSGANKTVKLTLTDYARNTGLFSQRAPIGYWLNYDYLLNIQPDIKILREITFFETEKTPEQKITGANVQPTDAVDYLRFNLAALGSEADVKELRVSLEAPIPEPLFSFFALLAAALILRKRR